MNGAQIYDQKVDLKGNFYRLNAYFTSSQSSERKGKAGKK